jgi:signal transduction histidine kinase
MKIRLVSQDGALQRLCGEILGEFPKENCELTVALTADPGADLCIWDYSEEVGMPPADSEEISKYLILLPRKDIAAFRGAPQFTAATLVLKPATRAVLRAFLGLAISNGRDRLSTAGSLCSDRDEILQCLIEANLRLQEYDQDRTNFLARGMHDFRAPLTALSGYCGLFLSEALGPVAAEQRQVLERMQQSTKRLSRMASAMFQLSIDRHTKRRPDLYRSDLQDCVDQALHEVAPLTESKHIGIVADLEERYRSLPCDASLIEQLLVNLLDNACKFTPRNGEIEIRGYPYFWDRRNSRAVMVGIRERRRQLNLEPNSYRLEIRNSGSGIPEQYLETIFEEYTSYNGAQDRSGAGLGLAICRMIALQHEGRIWAENTDAGPRFTLVLPAHSNEPAPSNHPNHVEAMNYAEVLE